MTPAALETHALARRFGRATAVAGVDLSVDDGQCLAVFGPNGAGKTTLLRLAAGLLKPTSGTFHVRGADLRGNAAVRARIGMISHQSMLYRALTARENVVFAARLYGMRDPAAAAADALRRMRILDRADTPVRSLSRGMQQRVSIARAIVHRPTLVLLDEPYTGLDAAGGAALTDMLRELRGEGAALVLVTHNVDEGLAIASHAAVMLNGTFVRYESVGTLDARDFTAGYRALVVDGHVAASPVA